jgi:hypothetical protein
MLCDKSDYWHLLNLSYPDQFLLLEKHFPRNFGQNLIFLWLRLSTDSDLICHNNILISNALTTVPVVDRASDDTWSTHCCQHLVLAMGGSSWLSVAEWILRGLIKWIWGLWRTIHDTILPPTENNRLSFNDRCSTGVVAWLSRSSRCSENLLTWLSWSVSRVEIGSSWLSWLVDSVLVSFGHLELKWISISTHASSLDIASSSLNWGSISHRSVDVWWSRRFHYMSSSDWRAWTFSGNSSTAD